jgi:acetyl esterase
MPSVHPDVQVFLDALGPTRTIPFETMTPGEARAFVAAFARPVEPLALPRVEDRTVPGPAGDVPVRVYWPEGEPPHPALVYFHGGGWVVGDLQSADPASRRFAQEAGVVVVSVDYRLAPEHPFPAPVDDCYAALEWAAANAEELGVDPARVAVGGDSAGGNLAAAVAIRARDRGGPALAYQLLVYPVTDHDFERPSYRENADGYLMSAAGMRWFWDQYVDDVDARSHPEASPVRGTCAGLPPAHVVTAELDPLRDEGEAFAERLREAGVAVTHTRYDGVVHGFFGMVDVLEPAQLAFAEAVVCLRDGVAPTVAA